VSPPRKPQIPPPAKRRIPRPPKLAVPPPPKRRFPPPPPKSKPISSDRLQRMAEAPIARQAPAVSSTVTLTFTVTLRRSRAEQLAARAIREGKTLADVVRERLESRTSS